MIKLFWNLFVLHLVMLNLLCFSRTLVELFRGGESWCNISENVWGIPIMSGLTENLLDHTMSEHDRSGLRPVSRRSRKVFRPGKPQRKSQTLGLQICFFFFFKQFSYEHCEHLKWLYGPDKLSGLSRNGPLL